MSKRNMMVRHYDNLTATAGPVLGCFLFFGIIFGVLFGLSAWTDRNLDFWVSYFKGVDVNVPYWLSFLVTVVANGFALVGNVIAEVARLCV